MVQIKEKLLKLPIYVGIDVHKEKWVVSIYKGTQKVETYSMSSNISDLINRLKTKYAGHQIKCVYEAGFCGYWIQKQLSLSEISCIVAHAADIPTTDYERKRKSDKLDSEKLAWHLSLGSIKGIYIPSTEQLKVRSLVRVRLTIAKEKRKWMCRIRSFLHFHGVEIPTEWKNRLWSKAGINFLNETSKDLTGLDMHIESYQNNRRQELKAANAVRSYIRQSQFATVYKFLMSTPGVGWTTASLLIGELGNMDRFIHLDKLAGFCGLVPDVRSSADRHKTLGISKRANRRLRSALIESAWVNIRHDPEMRKVYNKAIAEKKPSQKAIIKVARKLLNRIRAVWIKQENYQVKN